MTALGARRHDARGRSTGKRKVKSNVATIPEGVQWTALRYDLLESPAWRVLLGSELKLLFRIMVENSRECEAANGDLICTYQDFSAYGIDEKSIAPGLRTLEALGLLRIERGRAGNGEFRRPSVYRLTFKHTATAPPTNEWQAVETMSEARAIAKRARKG